MKKLRLPFLALFILFLSISPVHVYADSKSFTDLFGKITPPDSINNLTSQGGAGGLSTVLNNFISIIFVIGGIAVVFMVLLGAFQWITSGGEKENVAKARSRITNAIIVLILLALAFFLLTIIGKVLNFKFFT